jgi:hypothetical protein
MNRKTGVVMPVLDHPYESPSAGVQGSGVPAPPAPPIPTLPSRAGAGTGAGTGTEGVATTTMDGLPVDARQEVRDVLREVRNGLREGLRQGEGAQAVVLQPPPLPSNDIPQEVIPLVGIVMSMIAVMVIGHPIARAIARAMDRRGERGVVKAGDVMPQIRQLQDSVDAMAIELERISEAQRYTAKLMSERAPALSAGEPGAKA